MSMTKLQCLLVEGVIIEKLEALCGPGKEDGSWLTWEKEAPFGKVEFTLFRDSKKSGHVFRSSWLACRANIKAGLKYEYPFNKMNGKYNFHCGSEDTEGYIRSDLERHLNSITW